MKKTENILASLAFIGMVLRLFEIEGGTILLAIFFLLLGLFYLCFSAFLLLDIRLRSISRRSEHRRPKPRQILWAIFAGVSFFLHLMGILFLVQHWEGAWSILYVTIALLSVISSVSVFRYLSSSSEFHIAVLKRSGILLASTLVLYLITLGSM